MGSIIIGTAGHVDHGKTMLIKALTGKDTDRLEEEKKRGVSIDLGFASFSLPDGKKAGIIDVPGHEKFIHNMLAGAGGIDLIILVIDINEGIMPQTREHLSILELLGTQKGIIALTKVDAAEEEWCEIVEEEVRKELEETFLKDAPCVWVSSYTGRGLPELKEHIHRLNLEITSRDTLAPLRIPVDRCFVVAGFGTVITGTLLQGTVSVSDTVEVLPPGKAVRVRNVQVFGENVNQAEAGHRVALNLSGLEKETIERGSVVCAPGYFKLTFMLDATLQLLPRAPRSLKHMDPVHFYQGTNRVVARMALLDREELKPAEKAPVQVRTEKPLVAERSDRFIIRSYSPMTTIGGGLVLDPKPARRHRRYRQEIIDRLKKFEEEAVSGQAEGFLLQKLEQLEVPSLDDLEKETRMGRERIEELLSQLKREGKVVSLGDTLVPVKLLEKWEDKVEENIKKYHRENPLSPGLPRAEFKKYFPGGLSPKAFDAFWEYMREKEKVELFEDKVCMAGFRPQPSPGDREIIKKLEDTMEASRFQPPAPAALGRELKVEPAYLEKLLDYLVYQGNLVKIADNYYLLSTHYREAVEELNKHFQQNDKLTLAEFRDRLGTSRKYVQPLLEYFDREKITRRVGDYRILLK